MECEGITELSNNTQTLKFKTQLTVLFFATAIVIVDVSGNKDEEPNRFKRSCLWLVIGGF